MAYKMVDETLKKMSAAQWATIDPARQEYIIHELNTAANMLKIVDNNLKKVSNG